MDRIRLIASDMDATLLDGHSQLPPDFLHLVQELAGAGGLAPADGLRGGKRGFLCGLRAGERLPAPL